ncbi:SGNH/GDSL hydrolase family protein [Calothrix sp. 336/3]|uniref:SGNH/GDSL hydrolase family protein n=1 Tax=Calothrix sp. 336/3 TaxID=1337936 RepID=UPI00069C1820|nr:SGNH/GDSL hydrolase family protein [Calothrix sp. 336/3]
MFKIAAKTPTSALVLTILFFPVLLPLKALADSFDQFFIFGDSLSDNGNLYRITRGYFPPQPYYRGRASNGIVWVEILGQKLKINNDKIKNFAVIGSTTTNRNAIDEKTSYLIPSLPSQVKDFTASPNQPSSQAIFVLWAGANDYLAQPQNLRATDTQFVVNNISNAAQILIDRGARNLIIPNLPDLGKIPQEIALGTSNISTERSNSHNANLRLAVQILSEKNPHVKIILLDIHSLFQDVINQPVKYGFINVTQPCFNRRIFTVCSNPEDYLFWDDIHPTAHGHRMLAEYAQSVVSETAIQQWEIIYNKQSK